MKEDTSIQCSTIDETQSVFNLFKRWQSSIKKTDEPIKCMCCHRRMAAKTPKFVMRIKIDGIPIGVNYEFSRLEKGFSDDPNDNNFHIHEKCLAQQLGFGDKIEICKWESIIKM